MNPEELKKFTIYIINLLYENTSYWLNNDLKESYKRLLYDARHTQPFSVLIACQQLQRLVWTSVHLEIQTPVRLAKTTKQVRTIADFLNNNPAFRVEVLPGTANEKVTGEDLISYYNLRTSPAICQGWSPFSSKYHKLAQKDSTITAHETDGIIILRRLKDTILFRGDTRAPEEVTAARGFSPTVPQSVLADRANERALRELAVHFPARISFTSEMSVAKRYMRNAANRQGKHHSYIYYVNVKNMETIDLRQNIEEGRIGRTQSRDRVETFVRNWVEEQLVIGNSIPTDRIVKIEKFEVIPQDLKSTVKSIHHGYKPLGTYYPQEDGSFKFTPSDYADPAFHYEGICIVSLLGRRSAADPEAKHEHYAIDSVSYDRNTSYFEDTLKYKIGHVSMSRHHDSLPDTSYIKLIQLNYDLKEDATRNQWKRTRRLMREGLKDLKTPAKIYIFSREFEDSTYGLLSYSHCPHQKPEYYCVNFHDLATLFKQALPKTSEINFHLMFSNSFMAAGPMLEAFIQAGFTNCFITSYNCDFTFYQSTEDQSWLTIKLFDFGSAGHLDHARRRILHKKDKPEYEDNKIIAYYANGKVRQEGYREWIKRNPGKYSVAYRKNLWIQNMTAILSEITAWLDNETKNSDNSRSLQNVLGSLRNLAINFDRRMLEIKFDHQEYLQFLLSLFKSLDLITLYYDRHYQPIVHYADKLSKSIITAAVSSVSTSQEKETATKNPPAAGQKEFTPFKECYCDFRKMVLPIIPVEFKNSGYKVQELVEPSGNECFKVTENLSLDNITEKMINNSVPDFTDFL